MAGTPARTQHGTISTTLNQSKDEKDVGPLAIWSVSSAKPGNGVDLLVDGKSDTFWQSDGAQPHLITLQFQHSVQLSRVAIQTDFRMDESYTPQRIAVRVGTRSSDLRTVRTEEVHEPQGWINIPLGGRWLTTEIAMGSFAAVATLLAGKVKASCAPAGNCCRLAFYRIIRTAGTLTCVR